MDGYTLSRLWFDFAFENPDIVTPGHASLYFWFCELYNKLGSGEKFGVPTDRSMAAVGIRNYRTYKKIFDDLVNWECIEVIAKSSNQYTATVILLKYAPVKNTEAHNYAPAKNASASPRHELEQVLGTASINKAINNRKEKTVKLMSEVFTPDYKPNNTYESIAFKLWKQVYDYLFEKNIKPIALGRSKVSVWTNDIRLIIESDERTESEIDEVLKYISTNDFWMKNILSTAKLRQQFERLLMEARAPIKAKSNNIQFAAGNDQILSDQMDYSKPLSKV